MVKRSLKARKRKFGRGLAYVLASPLLIVILIPVALVLLCQYLWKRFETQDTPEVQLEAEAALGLADASGLRLDMKDILEIARDSQRNALEWVQAMLEPTWFDIPTSEDGPQGFVATCANGDEVRVWATIALIVRKYRPMDGVDVETLAARAQVEIVRGIAARESSFDASIQLKPLGVEVARVMDARDNDSHFHVKEIEIKRVEAI